MRTNDAAAGGLHVRGDDVAVFGREWGVFGRRSLGIDSEHNLVGAEGKRGRSEPRAFAALDDTAVAE